MFSDPHSLFHFWDLDDGDGMVTLDCMMPNGCLIPLHLHRDIPLNHIKEVGRINLFLHMKFILINLK